MRHNFRGFFSRLLVSVINSWNYPIIPLFGLFIRQVWSFPKGITISIFHDDLLQYHHAQSSQKDFLWVARKEIVLILSSEIFFCKMKISWSKHEIILEPAQFCWFKCWANHLQNIASSFQRKKSCNNAKLLSGAQHSCK